MILYPVLEAYFKLAMKIPIIIWFGIGVFLLVISFCGHPEIGEAIFLILASPIGLYLLCYACKWAYFIPLIGAAGVIIRIAVDISVIWGIIQIIRFFLIR